jgi:predicted AlkP superfamily pyrophosphatase or phosphodiesterase
VTRPQRPLLYVLVDAIRYDYVEPVRTPFLSSLGGELGLARMRPLLGYSDAIRAAIFTGKYPDEHGYWMEYCYRPESSPYGRLDRLAPLDALPSDFVRRGTKFVLSKTVVAPRGRKLGYASLSLRHLPFRALGSFDWTLRREMSAPAALGVPTLFDRLSDAGLVWAHLDASKLGTRRLLACIDALPRDTSFVFVYLHQVDMASHLFGLRSRLFERTLARTDALAGEVTARARRRLGELDLSVFSDHGMSSVERIVSYPKLWRHRAFPSRFCFALDATMVRLWYHDEDPSLRAELRAVVAGGAPGHFLSRAEQRDLHLDFDDRLYGDDIYLLEPRTAIFPNFHSMLRPKAMHAYHPDDSEQQGIAIGLPQTSGTVELVELATHALGTLGVGALESALAS